VISYNAWQRLFHGDPHVLGKTVRSESHTYTVVGVTPPEFGGIYLPLRIDLWVPFRFWAGDNAEHMRVMVFGSLKRGVTLSQASAELNAIAAGRTRCWRRTPTRHSRWNWCAAFPAPSAAIRQCPW
jgi:hypothetical protein